MKKYIKPESCVYDLHTEGMIANSDPDQVTIPTDEEPTGSTEGQLSNGYQGPYDSSQWED